MMGILFVLSGLGFVFCLVAAIEMYDLKPTIVFASLAVLSLIGFFLAGNQLSSDSDKKCNSNIVVYQIAETHI